MVMRYVSATMWAEQSLNFIIWSTRVPFYPDQLLRSRIKSKLGQHGSSPGCLSSPLRDHRTSRGAWSCCLGPVDRVLLLFNPKKKFLPSSCNDCIYVRGGLTSLTTCQQGRSRYHQRRTIVACESLSVFDPQSAPLAPLKRRFMFKSFSLLHLALGLNPWQVLVLEHSCEGLFLACEDKARQNSQISPSSSFSSSPTSSRMRNA
ncbi:uncharacterized protein LOC123983499 isoform X1 [Micropterus dolomieu]|uniref:uncharacterized protein LOC123983499 isoform X1 n=1 Tax=Micropterus dolomieu TaxID=147949 RepID=UPI001E8CCD2D|nr:uncharacterized protein LOC123983499 isoform X1 [Micropterus dolomieu]